MGKVDAAGAVVFRREAGKTQVAMIHRPRYDDWTFPKGKLHKGEPPVVGAVREVREETGLTVRLGAPLGALDYKYGSTKKHVSFWCATPTRSEEPLDDEADALEWLSFPQARKRSSYKDYTDLIDVAKHCRETTPLIILRHAKAKERKGWKRADAKRPLNSRGRKQSEALIDVLTAYGVERVITSPSVRCADTVAPYLAARELEAELPQLLTEETGERDQAGVRRYMRELAREVGRSGIPTVVCGHRPLLPAMLRGVGQAPTSFATADCLVLHVNKNGRPQIDEFHASTL